MQTTVSKPATCFLWQRWLPEVPVILFREVWVVSLASRGFHRDQERHRRDLYAWPIVSETFLAVAMCQGSDGNVLSDGVLNPSGVRFGSAEIYAVTDTIPEIEDAICVGQQRPKDDNETVLLFIKLRPNVVHSSSLTSTIKEAIKKRFTPRHVPRYIFEVAQIPYTVNGKKCEINVKQVVTGKKAVIGGTVANPESIELYERYFHLEREVKRLEGSLGKI